MELYVQDTIMSTRIVRNALPVRGLSYDTPRHGATLPLSSTRGTERKFYLADPSRPVTSIN